MSAKIVKVTLYMKTGGTLNGFINIVEYKRFSDFIENHPAKHLKLFNASVETDAEKAIINFLLVPKENILYYQPFDEQSVKKIKL
jgi:hypothetical protein